MPIQYQLLICEEEMVGKTIQSYESVSSEKFLFKFTDNCAIVFECVHEENYDSSYVTRKIQIEFGFEYEDMQIRRALGETQEELQQKYNDYIKENREKSLLREWQELQRLQNKLAGFSSFEEFKKHFN